jgi:hypothetical protein
MYAFAQRADTQVVDEPLYAAYLARFPELDHPGRAAILRSQPTLAETVIDRMRSGPCERAVVVFKQMTHHLTGLSDWSFALEMANVLLIRDPRAIIASYSRVIPEPTLQDVGIGLQYELFGFLHKRGALQAVLDARELLLDPPGVLRQLCSRLGIPFEESMLSWAPGPRPEDGVWAGHWYHRVHGSSGFAPYEERKIELDEQQEALAAKCNPLYKTLQQYALRASR